MYEVVKELIDAGRNVIITGNAGTGKTYILNKLREEYDIDVTSTTGLSAMNIKGQTIHSWAGIGICNKPVDSVVMDILYKKPALLQQLQKCKILAIDEISMLDGDTLNYINQVLKKVRGNINPFGGIQVLFFGDFFQLPPVNKDRGFCFDSITWNELKLEPVILKKVYRQNDLDFINALNNARVGKLEPQDVQLFLSRDIEIDADKTDVLHIFSTNNEADSYNVEKFNQIDEPVHSFVAVDYIYRYNPDGSEQDIIEIPDFNIEKLTGYDEINNLKNLDKNCKAPKELQLKEGCKVMLLKNLDFGLSLVNGSIGTVKEIDENGVYVRFDNGVGQYILKETFEYHHEGKLRAERKQYPLRLAYGITIHKSQGMTLDTVRINLNRIFEAGQAYVALSRARTLEGLYLKNFKPKKIFANKEIVAFYDNLEAMEIMNKPEKEPCIITSTPQSYIFDLDNPDDSGKGVDFGKHLKKKRSSRKKKNEPANELIGVDEIPFE